MEVCVETKHWHVEVKKIVYWTQRVFSKFHETYLTTTVYETFEDKEINLVDDFVKDLLLKEDVSVVYVKEVKTLSQTIVYKG
jgi:hypothetical protein